MVLMRSHICHQFTKRPHQQGVEGAVLGLAIRASRSWGTGAKGEYFRVTANCGMRNDVAQLVPNNQHHLGNARL